MAGICRNRRRASGKIKAGSVTFTVSGTWTAPANMTIKVFCVGGGGSTGNASDSGPRAMGGAAGGYTTTAEIQVTKDTVYSVIVGAGGTVTQTYYGNTGGASSFGGAIAVALGGEGSSMTTGGNGGSGGGAGTTNTSTGVTSGGNGGSDGSNGSNSNPGTAPGTGQGTTTRAFGEATGTLYAGGGGGADYAYSTLSATAGQGGANGGGNGGALGINTIYAASTPGTPNTGGGAGGPIGQAGYLAGEIGGSGIVIIKWDEQEAA